MITYKSFTNKHRIELVKDKAVPECKVTGPSTIFQLFKSLRSERKEHIYVVCLNSKNMIMGIDLVSIGHLTGTSAYPREVFQLALAKPTASIFLVHNHPSGNSTPSIDDEALTDNIRAAGKILDIELRDHIIIGDEDYYSFTDDILRSAPIKEKRNKVALSFIEEKTFGEHPTGIKLEMIGEDDGFIEQI